MTHEEPDRSSEDHCKYPTNNESCPPTSPIQKLSKTFSQDTTSSDAAWHAGGGGLLTPCTHREDPPAHFEARLCNAGFALKIAQWSLCILCTGLFFEGSSLIYDFKNQLFPYIVYWTYMIITGVIILSYLLGQKMREMLIRVYNIIGAIMFFIASIIIFSITVAEWDNWNNEYTNSSTFVENSIPKSSKTDIPTKPKLAKMLLTQSVLCLLNSFVYFLDIAYSLYTSYNTVKFRVQIKST